MALGFTMEASTPFVSLRAVLANSGGKRSKVYLLNGFLMLVVFFACRIVLLPYMYWIYARQVDLSVYQTASDVIPKHCNLVMFLTFALQLHWFAKMCKGAALVAFTKNST